MFEAGIVHFLFVFFAIFCIVGALCVLLVEKLFYNALGLLASLIATAGLFALMGKEFLAVVQLMVYVGGILVLLIFAVFFVPIHEEENLHRLKIGLGFVVCLLVGGGSIYALRNTFPIKSEQTASSVFLLGEKLMTDYLLVFELAGILLTIAMIGAISILKSSTTLSKHLH